MRAYELENGSFLLMLYDANVRIVNRSADAKTLSNSLRGLAARIDWEAAALQRDEDRKTAAAETVIPIDIEPPVDAP